MADVFQVSRGGFRAAKGWKKAHQDKFLSRKEFSGLLKATRTDSRKYGSDAYDLFSVACNFGLRCNEALDLAPGDFKTVHFGYFRVRTLKRRAKVEDRVHVDDAHAALVEEILKSRSVRSKTHLFPFGDRTARYLFGYYAKIAGLSPNVSFHSLRHTAARTMLEATGNGDPTKGSMRIVKHFLRHTPTPTEIYTEPTPEEMVRAMRLKGVLR